MSSKKLLIGTLIAFVYLFLIDYLWYAQLMSNFYTDVPGVNRVDVLIPWIALGQFLLGYAFCRLYLKGFDANSPLVSQGVKHGLMISILMIFSVAFIRYGVNEHAPLSEYLVDACYHTIQLIVLGIIIALFFGAEGGRPGQSGGGGT